MKKMLTKVKKQKQNVPDFVRLALTVPFHFLVIAAICLPEPEPPLIHQRFELKHYPPGYCSLSSSKTVLQNQTLPTDHWVTLPSDSH